MTKLVVSNLPFVNADGVAFGIKNKRHVADGRGERFELKLHAVGFQVRDGGVEIIHFQCD